MTIFFLYNWCVKYVARRVPGRDHATSLYRLVARSDSFNENVFAKISVAYANDVGGDFLKGPNDVLKLEPMYGGAISRYACSGFLLSPCALYELAVELNNHREKYCALRIGTTGNPSLSTLNARGATIRKVIGNYDAEDEGCMGEMGGDQWKGIQVPTYGFIRESAIRRSTWCERMMNYMVERNSNI